MPTPRTAARALAGLAPVLGLVLTGSGLLATPASAAPGGDGLAPVHGAGAPGTVKDRYIVVMKEQSTPAAERSARSDAVAKGGRVTHDYGAALRGFAAELPARALDGLRHNPNVAYIEADREVSVSSDQSGATWGLDRVDQRDLPLSSTYHYDYTGSGVTAYVIDTGVLTGHNEFTGRTASGFTAISDGRGTTDCNGHGTHVAGTVGGSTYGVAKGVTIRPVRVLDCTGSGSNSGVIAGVDWVTSNHTAGTPAVANMSLGGGVSSALDTAVQNSINDGVVYAVAAGNDYAADACNGSPSRVIAALTVGATTTNDARSSFSNIGACLDLFAPGSNITSAWYTGTAATSTLSGTSMATPHVAGVAALYLQANPTASPATVTSAIVNNASTGKVTDAGTGSPNLLLHALWGTTTTEPAPTQPPAPTNLVRNPGFESGATAWSASAGVITNSTSRPARTGSWKAWLNGYGYSSSETVSQLVTIPAATKATLSFWVRIDSAETTTTTANDRLRVQVVSGGTTSTLATYSNLNKNTSYVQKSLNLSAYVGKSVTIRFIGTENSSRQTSFVIDDTSLITG